MESSSRIFNSVTISAPFFKVPKTVKLYLRSFIDNRYLLRLFNVDQTTPIDISIPDGWKVTEQTLSANQLLSEWKQKQYKWNESSEKSNKNIISSVLSWVIKHLRIIFLGMWQLEDDTVTLDPYQIRTFIL